MQSQLILLIFSLVTHFVSSNTNDASTLPPKNYNGIVFPSRETNENRKATHVSDEKFEKKNIINELHTADNDPLMNYFYRIEIQLSTLIDATPILNCYILAIIRLIGCEYAN